MGGGGTLISVYPEELTFLFELDKPCYCNLKVVNNSEHHVAFKVKTTSPRKYFVRPNSSIVQPWDSCTITITLQAQKEYPPDMQSKDKFLIQSTKVAASTDMDEIPPDTFNKEGEKVIEEMKLKVVYTLPSGGSDDSGVTSSANRSFRQGSDELTMLKNASIEQIPYYSRGSMHGGGNGTYYAQQNHEDLQYVSSDDGSQNGNSNAQVFQSQYCTLESSSANCLYPAHGSTSSHCISGSPLSQQDSHSDHTYGSPPSASCVTEVPGLKFTTFEELENAMFGPESDIVSSDSSLLIGSALHQDNWRELLGINTGDLKQVIVACGKAVDDNDLYRDLLISELRNMVSVSGEPMQRLGAYMLEGLVARLSSSGHALYKSLKCKEPMSSELMSYMHLLYEICPFFKFGYMSANGAIAEAVKGENFVHIIDFQIAQGSQWATMIQALAARPGGPPCLRITGIDDSNSAHARGGGLDIVGQRLHSIAHSCGLPFEFNAVPAASHEVMLEHLNIRSGEVIAVNFAYQLHHTPDESVGIENHRDRILRMVKSLSPMVVTLVEQEANTNTAPFFHRYMETLDYYTAMFEAIDVACPRDDRRRISTEQHCVARDIVNLIACEGAERVERHEPFGKWRARLAMAGFRQYPLSALVNRTIKTLLDNYHSHYRLEERDGVLYLGWKNRKLVVSSAWR